MIHSITINFSIELPCDLVVVSITPSCDDSSVTTYSGSVDFTGGNTGVVYTITAPSGVVIGGDDPALASQGAITFSNMPSNNLKCFTQATSHTWKCNANTGDG